MKILAVNGSPTKSKGMTDVTMNNFLEGAKAEGADVEYIQLSEKKINYCTGCFSCWVKTPGTCIFKDDMPEILEKIKAADVLVLGTPLYVDGMSAQTKTFIDRIIPLVQPEIDFVDGHNRHRKRLDRVPDIVLLSVCGFYELDNFDGLVDHVKRICKNFRSKFIGSILRPASYVYKMEDMFPEEVVKIKDALKKAGKELVMNRSFNDKTLENIASIPLNPDDFIGGANIFWEMCKKEKKFIYHSN